MKRKISTALAVVLVSGSVPIQTFANTDTENKIQKVNDIILKENNYVSTGKLELDINFPMPIKNSKKNDMKVLLNKDGNKIAELNLSGENSDVNLDYEIKPLNYERKLVQENQDINFYHIILNNLEKGIYDVEISGGGYSTVTESVEINSYSQRVSFASSESKIQVASENNAKDFNYNGSFLVGDINDDKVVDQKDYDDMLNKMGVNISAKNSHDNNYDLNKDGKIDIADLTYINENMDKHQQNPTHTPTDAIIDPENVEIVVPEGTQGNPKDLLKDNTETVKVPVSAENPAQIAIDLTNNNQTLRNNESVTMEQVVIKAATEDDLPSNGSIVLGEGTDAIEVPISSNNTIRTRNGESEIVIDLGSQIAVKKITINVNGNRGNKTISEIAKVEFLNDVYKEIPKPDMNIPHIQTVETNTDLHAEGIDITWEPQPNVTSYKVRYQKIKEKKDGEPALDGNGKPIIEWTKELQVNEAKLHILDKSIKPYDLIRVSVQAVNGEWESGYADSTKISESDKGFVGEPLDGIADNVDNSYNPTDGYYGENNAPKDKGTISEIRVIPRGLPQKPINMKTTSGFRSGTISWPEHKRAKEFDVYYRKMGTDIWHKANDENRIVTIENNKVVEESRSSKRVKGSSFMLKDLADDTTYEVKMTATNHFGTSELSEGFLLNTRSVIPPNSTNYKLMNRPVGTNKASENIQSVEYKNWDKSIHGEAGPDEFAIVDGDYVTSWTASGTSPGNNSPIVTFKEATKLDTVVYITRLDGSYAGGHPNYVTVKYDDGSGEMKQVDGVSLERKREDGNEYATLTFKEPITVKRIQVQLNTHPSYIDKTSFSELKFYNFDSLERDIKDLFADDVRITLKDNVTQEMLDELTKRANTMDTANKEYHPKRKILIEELKIAQQLLDDAKISQRLITLDPNINNYSGGPGLGMGNDWQALGTVARPGKDENNRSKDINVYMGSNNPNAKVQITFLQSYGPVGDSGTGTVTIKPGKTTIQIPSILSENYEKGGVVMARVSAAGSNDKIQLRLSGTDDIPYIDVHNLINDSSKENEVKDIARQYLRDLKRYVKELPTMHPGTSTDDDKTNNVYPYDPNTSPLDSTDIEGDRFSITFPASKVLSSIQSGLNGDENKEVERIYNALLAWEQEVQVGYAKKGVYEEAKDFNGNGKIDEDKNDTTSLIDGLTEKEYYEKHKAPQTRLNVKYQRMMMGAAGYASGHHIGVPGLGNIMQGVPYKFDENGKVKNSKEAKLYGDLIGHEMGHIMDIGQRTYPETSNNLMAVLTSTMLNQDSGKLSRGTYESIYKKVTSNTIGLSTNRSVVLGMLWQPYLAYEDNNTYEMLSTDNDAEKNNDSYFAKLNRAYRTMTDEEKANGDRDQYLIRLTSKVAGKDLSDFYKAHGIVSNQTTLKYVSQFEKESKPIQYINDEVRRRRIDAINKNNMSLITMSKDTKAVAKFGQDSKGNKISDRSYVNQKEIPLELSVTKDNDKIFGYEILRNGKPSGFVLNNGATTKYTDIIDTVNNRTFKYEVVAYDYNLNATEKIELGTIKVRHDGRLSKSLLDLTTNTIDKNNPNYDKHEIAANPSLKHMIDNNLNTTYEGKKDGNEDPYVIIDANSERTLAGIKYSAPTTTTKLFKLNKLSKNAIQKYEVQVSKDGNNWTKVKEGSFDLSAKDSSQTIYFDKEGSTGGNQLHTYNARFVKLIAKGASEISISELELLSPPGDNIEIGVSSDNIDYKNGIGILSNDFIYQKTGIQPDDPSTPDLDESAEQKIPKGSIIFTGEYSGNPAFNIPLVLNENEEHVADKYNGILMAEIPEGAELGTIAKGTWVYWIEPEVNNAHINKFKNDNKKVFAELYRTDTADPQDKGQRLTSNSFDIDVPNNLPSISLNGGVSRNANENKAVKAVEIDKQLVQQIIDKR